MIELVLLGPLKGKTKTLKGIQFREGRAKIKGDLQTNFGLLRYMVKSYQAYHINHELVLKDGVSDLQQDSSESVQTDLQQEGSGASEIPADVGDGTTPTEDGDERGSPTGDGHADTRVPEDEEDELKSTIETAVSLLDHSNDEHWNKDGRVSVETMTSICGQSINRRQLDNYVPDLKRKVEKQD